jgi:hypothetical protein
MLMGRALMRCNGAEKLLIRPVYLSRGVPVLADLGN